MAETTQTAMPGVVPYIMSSDASAAIDFYARAFDARTVGDIMRMDDGKRVMHCQLEINGGAFMLGDAMPEYGHGWQTPQGTTLTLAVADPRRWWDRAVEAGCEVTMPLEVAFWGDLYGQVKDPFGHAWAIVGPPDGK
ncbi:VOC family protein [Pararhizobium haloflavum]|uniref:VOC family protein n=1 Tax=Pararhizobium haloflavum TaxID=2037914 RepID=UPI000C178A8F|nr:glyoxalase/bleomycin resistance/extradiol dioxygenase family protein [Pararhizobium haloflavum]